MRYLLLMMGCCLFVFEVLAKENPKFYRQISLVVSHPYHFTGLWPAKPQEKVEKYEFTLDDRDHPIRITYYDANGEIANSEDGWALYKVEYDSKGRLIESSFFKVDGKPALGKSVGFSKEVVEYNSVEKPTTRYYSPTGRPLKVLESGQIDSFRSLSP